MRTSRNSMMRSHTTSLLLLLELKMRRPRWKKCIDILGITPPEESGTAKSNKLRGKKQAVLEVIENCKTCSQFKKSPPRPKVGLPVAYDFNDIVGLDLKVISKTKGEYILWMVDLFSKMIKGKFIKNK